MSDIAKAVARRRAGEPKDCLTAVWLATLDEDDRAEITDYALQHPASAHLIASEFGFLYARSTWTRHFKGRCTCEKGES